MKVASGLADGDEDDGQCSFCKHRLSDHDPLLENCLIEGCMCFSFEEMDSMDRLERELEEEK